MRNHESTAPPVPLNVGLNSTVTHEGAGNGGLPVASSNQPMAAFDMLANEVGLAMHASRGSALAGLEHYVRVTRTDRQGYVQFEYAIGDPSLHLDMILPPAAFREFCARHRVTRLPSLETVEPTSPEEHHVD